MRALAPGAIVLLLVTIGLTGCGGNQRQRALKTSLTAINAARDGFEKWDETQQQKIVAEATSKEAGRAALDEFRAKRDKIFVAFEVAYRAIAGAALQDDELSLKTAQKMANEVIDAISKLQE